MAVSGRMHAAVRVLLAVFLCLSMTLSILLGPWPAVRAASAEDPPTLVIRVVDAETGERVEADGAAFMLMGRYCPTIPPVIVVGDFDPCELPGGIPNWWDYPPFVVADNGPSDDDPAPGRIEISPPIGQYEIIQAQAPEGYLRDPDPQSINLYLGSAEVEFQNQPAGDLATAALTIYSTGDPEIDGPGYLLGGGTYEFCRVTTDGCTDAQTVTDNGGGDEDPTPGIIRLTGLSAVECTLSSWEEILITEVESPAGYLAPTEPLPNVLCAGHESTATFQHRRDIGRPVMLAKIFDPLGQPLGGATIAYCRQEDAFIVRCQEGTRVLVTDNGPGDNDARPGYILINGLSRSPFYAVWQEDAPSGWVPDDEPVRNINFESDDVRVVAFFSERLPARLIIKRLDEEDQLLGGATFRVTGPGGYDQTFTDTDGDGVVEVTGLDWGPYLVTETQPPAGHDLDPTPEHVTLDGTHLEATVIIASEPTDRQPADPQAR